MSDFNSIVLQGNTGSDITPIWTGTALNPGGTGGANEIRFCASGAGSAVTANNWPLYTLPGSVGAVPECWFINTDNGTTATGYKLVTYGAPTGGVVPFSLMARWGWTQDGTFATAPKITMYANSTLTNPSAGTQPPGANNDTITNGSASDTGSTSYAKIQAFGYGVDGSGSQQTPAAGSLTTPVAATDGTAGTVSPATNAWLATHWQSAQGSIQQIQGGVTPAWTTHTGSPVITYYWYTAFLLFAGPNMTVNAAITPVLGFFYTFI